MKKACFITVNDCLLNVEKIYIYILRYCFLSKSNFEYRCVARFSVEHVKRGGLRSRAM